MLIYWIVNNISRYMYIYNRSWFNRLLPCERKPNETKKLNDVQSFYQWNKSCLVHSVYNDFYCGYYYAWQRNTIPKYYGICTAGDNNTNFKKYKLVGKWSLVFETIVLKI